MSLPASALTSPAAIRGRVYYKTIVGLALVLRLGVVAMVLCSYPRNWLFSKAPDLGFLAQSLSAGHGLSSPFGGSTGPTAFLAPGYPAILGLIFCLFDSYSLASAAAIMGLQTLFAVLTVAAILHIARRIFGVPTANLAGIFWAVSPPLIWLPAVPWETSLSTLLLTAMVVLALWIVNNPRQDLWAITGIYCGLAMLVNPSLTLALFAILGWSIYQTRFVWSYGPWVCGLTLLVVFAPWPLRNAKVLHAFIPLRSNFGYELWQGNHPGATGLFDQTIEPLENQREYDDYVSEGEVAYMSHKSMLAKTYISAEPWEFFRLSGERTVRFWTGSGSGANSSVVEAYAVLTSLLGLIGLAALFRKDRQRATAMLFLLPIAVFPLPYYITHPDFRFRLLLDPLLTILGAYTVTHACSDWKNRA
jgi:4-amino-4-deoxy-L-arabinose transferase-like glycosyltransferase